MKTRTAPRPKISVPKARQVIDRHEANRRRDLLATFPEEVRAALTNLHGENWALLPIPTYDAHTNGVLLQISHLTSTRSGKNVPDLISEAKTLMEELARVKFLRPTRDGRYHAIESYLVRIYNALLLLITTLEKAAG